jgi:hypothetical protein
MALKEGVRRINKLGRILGTTGALLMLLNFVEVLAAALWHSSAAILGPFLLLGIYFLILGIVVVTIGWIVEGFTQKDELE